MTTTQRRPSRPMIAAACTATLGFVLALGAPAADGTLVEGLGEGEINWTEVNGDDVWSAVVDTGPGTIEWTMEATEEGFFIGSGGSPYGGCGGTVDVP